MHHICHLLQSQCCTGIQQYLLYYNNNSPVFKYCEVAENLQQSVRSTGQMCSPCQKRDATIQLSTMHFLCKGGGALGIGTCPCSVCLTSDLREMESTCSVLPPEVDLAHLVVGAPITQALVMYEGDDVVLAATETERPHSR